MNILSVDWDYFFPNMEEYDWSMKEGKKFFYELIWYIRWSNIGIKNRVPAHDRILPDAISLHFFWQRALIRDHRPNRIVVCDSHADIVHFLDDGCNVWNFDQHHDCGYSANYNLDDLDCGNWGLHNSIDEFHQIYPEWRQESAEIARPHRDICIWYGYPEIMPKFDLVFVCRSSCWCPSWADNEFALFLKSLEKHMPNQFENKLALEYAMKPRPFDLKIAKQFRGVYESKSAFVDKEEIHRR